MVYFMVIVLRITYLQLCFFYIINRNISLLKPHLYRANYVFLYFLWYWPLSPCKKINSNSTFNWKMLTMVNLYKFPHGIFYILVHHICCKSVPLARNSLFFGRPLSILMRFWKFFHCHPTISQTLRFFFFIFQNFVTICSKNLFSLFIEF